MAVYADFPQRYPVAETFATEPLSAYGASKLAAERYLAIAGEQQQWCWFNLRLSNTFGPGQHLSPYVRVLTIFLDQLQRRQPLTIFRDERQMRDFVHVEDVATALLLALRASRDNSGTYNIGTGVGTTILADCAKSAAGHGHSGNTGQTSGARGRTSLHRCRHNTC